jgi:hypothetical protein
MIIVIPSACLVSRDGASRPIARRGVIALLAQGDPPYYQVRQCHISQVPAGRSF